MLPMIAAQNTDIFPDSEIVKLYIQKVDKIKFMMKFENASLMRDINLDVRYKKLFTFHFQETKTYKVAAWPVSHVSFQSF